MPVPSGQPMFRQVMDFAKRTECFSASLRSPGKSSAVPSFFVSGLRIEAGLSGSEMTSSFQVSRVRPASRGAPWPNPCDGRTGDTESEEIPPRQLLMFEEEIAFHSGAANRHYCTRS